MGRHDLAGEALIWTEVVHPGSLDLDAACPRVHRPLVTGSIVANRQGEYSEGAVEYRSQGVSNPYC